MTFELVVYILLGISAGFLSALFGVGGGIIIVPALAWILPQIGVDGPHVMLIAISTSLVSTFLVTNVAVVGHYKKGAVDFRFLKKVALSIALGSCLGAFSAKEISGVYLKIFFAIFLMIVGFYMFIGKADPEHPTKKAIHPNIWILSFICFCIGFAATILGIAGGFFSFPLLFFLGFHAKMAVGTACGFGAIISTVGAIVYLFENHGPSAFRDTIGCVYLPAALIIGVTSLAVSPYAIYAAHKLPVHLLKRFLGVFLVLFGFILLWR